MVKNSIFFEITNPFSQIGKLAKLENNNLRTFENKKKHFSFPSSLRIKKTNFILPEISSWSKLKIIKEKDIGGIVVGLPLNMNGTKGPRCQSVETFFRNFLIFHDIPLLFQDERMSSQAIEKIFISQDVSRKRRSSNIDKHAASWILQSALDFLKKRCTN